MPTWANASLHFATSACSGLSQPRLPTHAKPLRTTGDPEGFEGEVFQLLVDQDIILNTDTEPAGFQDYFFAFLPWLFLAAFMFYMFSQVRSNGNQIMQFGKSKAKELDEESPKVTFKDVAGVEEAKEELEEKIGRAHV